MLLNARLITLSTLLLDSPAGTDEARKDQLSDFFQCAFGPRKLCAPSAHGDDDEPEPEPATPLATSGRKPASPVPLEPALAKTVPGTAPSRRVSAKRAVTVRTRPIPVSSGCTR